MQLLHVISALWRLLVVIICAFSVYSLATSEMKHVLITIGLIIFFALIGWHNLKEFIYHTEQL